MNAAQHTAYQTDVVDELRRDQQHMTSSQTREPLRLADLLEPESMAYYPESSSNNTKRASLPRMRWMQQQF
jgi:hypothetical protein